MQRITLPEGYNLSAFGKVFITLKGYEDRVPSQFWGENVVGLDPEASILYWFLTLPEGVQLELLKPPEVDPQEWARFEHLVQGAMMSRGISLRAIMNGERHWIENAFRNWPHFSNAKSVDALPPRASDTAFIIGNGPSAKDFLKRKNLPDADWFACWHSLQKVVNFGKPVHSVTHIDPYQFQEADAWKDSSISADVPVITSPSSDPAFLERFSEHPKYLVLDQGRVVNGIIAKVLGMPDHPHIVGNVGHCMAQVAALQGYKKIVLAGIDMAAQSKDDYIFTTTGSERLEGVNKHGNKFYSHSAFLTHASGFEDLVQQHPHIEFYNASKVGIDFEGYRSF